MALRISVLASKDLLTAILVLKGLDRELAKQIRATIKTFSQAEWQEAVRGNTRTAQEVRVLSDTARVAVSDQNVTLKSASVGKSLSGGYKPSQLAAATEFGSDHTHTKSYQATSSKGRSYTVHKRHTQNQFPVRRTAGPVYNAAADVIPRVAAAMAQTVFRSIAEALEGGSK